MNSCRKVLALLSLLVPLTPTSAETVAIVHALAWTLHADEPIEDATIVVEAGRIVSVSASAPAPENARVIDAGGKPVTPGLFNAATQLGLFEAHGANETVDHSTKTGAAGAPGAGFDVQYAINPHAAPIGLARADGLTSAVTHPGSGAVFPFSGLAALLRLEEGGARVERAQIALFVTIGGSSATASVGSRAAQWQMLRAALDAARSPPAPATTPAPVRGPDARALELAVTGKLPVSIQVQRASDILQAIRLKQDYAIPVIIVGGAEAWLHAAALAAAAVPVVLDPYANLPMSFDEVGARVDNAALLQKAGVRIAFSTSGIHSYNAGSSLREGAGIAVAEGLPYIEGLRAITLEPARIWGIDDRVGSIAAGLNADLVIWDGDPLEPTTLPVAVLVSGREVSLETRQTLLRERYRRAANAAGAPATP